MRRIEDVFVGARIAGQNADDVVRRRTAQRIVEAKARGEPQRHRLEPLGLGGGGQIGEILARGFQNCLSDGLLDPAIGHGLVHVVIGLLDVILRAGPARIDHVPAVCRREGVVDDDRRGRPLTGRFLELVGPASVIGHAAPFEEAVLRFHRIVGIVHQDDRSLPLHVDPGIIVPAQLGGHDAIAHEHQRAVLDVHLGRDAIADGDILIAERIGLRGAGALDRQRRIVIARDLHGRDRLQPLAVVAGLQARLLELGDDVIEDFRLHRRAGRTPFEIVLRKALGHRFHQGNGGGDRRFRLRRGHRTATRRIRLHGRVFRHRRRAGGQGERARRGEGGQKEMAGG